ncbi:MAG: LSm family protein, partial [Thermoanaerobaculales bacterium]|nr:LSm family protein [Thermoanaerobaculales bacterium]
HMMLGTDPANVTLCLDAHWIYRGAGNSAVALFDVVKLYGRRVTELHLRQSKANIWTEALSEGDIDETVKYLSIAGLIDRIDTSVLEVAEEAVDRLLALANVAAYERKWDEAARNTAEARSVANRFGLDTGRIDAAENRYAEMQLSRIVKPDETQVLRAAIGKDVEVKLDNGAVIVGRILAVDRSNLVLDIEDDVGGGVVSFTDEVPLSTVRWIKIWAE